MATPLHAAGTNTAITIINGEVHRGRKPWSGVTFSLLSQLWKSGVRDIPRPLRQAVEVDVYHLIPGNVILRPWPAVVIHSESLLNELGKALRRIHDASQPLVKDAALQFPWGPACADVPDDWVVCHGDLGPWNVVIDENGKFTGIIDWDLARFGPRIEDLTEAAYELGPLRVTSQRLAGEEMTPRRVTLRVAALLRGYGALHDQEEIMRHVPVYLEQRAKEITAHAKVGLEPFLSFHRRGLDEVMRREAAEWRICES